MITTIILFLESIGTGELMVVMLFVLLFFGSEKIPDLAKGLGKGMRQMKDAMNGVQSEITQGMRDVEKSISDEIPKIEVNPLSQPVTKIESEATITRHILASFILRTPPRPSTIGSHEPPDRSR